MLPYATTQPTKSPTSQFVCSETSSDNASPVCHQLHVSHFHLLAFENVKKWNETLLIIVSRLNDYISRSSSSMQQAHKRLWNLRPPFPAQSHSEGTPARFIRPPSALLYEEKNQHSRHGSMRDWALCLAKGSHRFWLNYREKKKSKPRFNQRGNICDAAARGQVRANNPIGAPSASSPVLDEPRASNEKIAPVSRNCEQHRCCSSSAQERGPKIITKLLDRLITNRTLVVFSETRHHLPSTHRTDN